VTTRGYRGTSRGRGTRTTTPKEHTVTYVQDVTTPYQQVRQSIREKAQQQAAIHVDHNGKVIPSDPEPAPVAPSAPTGPAAADLAQARAALGLAAGSDGQADATTYLAVLAESVVAERAGQIAQTRAEVAVEKGFTPEQAAVLIGTTREEMAADADRLAAMFPGSVGVAPPAPPATPRPDPSQGAQPSGLVDPGEQALKDGDVLGSIRHQVQQHFRY
jgi:hypothetical protein